MIRRLPHVLAGAAVLVALLAGPATAHVTVNPREATAGGYTKLSFRVPTESDDASTVKLQVKFPDPSVAPLASVRVQPHPGWRYEVVKAPLEEPIESEGGAITEVVDTITWTADSPEAGVKPGEFEEFNVSVGPLPSKAGPIEFKAVQTYSNGEEAKWIETGEDAEHPAPVLTLTAAGDDADAEPAAATADVDEEDDDGPGTVLGIVGIVLGALALVVAVTARRRS